MDEAKLQEIEARANAATPGPWRSGGFYGLGRMEDGDRAGWVLGGVFPMGRCAFCARAPEPCPATVMHRGEYDAAPRPYHAHWIATESDDGWHSISSTMAALAITGNYDYEQGGVCSTPEDSAFIVHARTDVPALVAEVRRITAALATARREGAEEMRADVRRICAENIALVEGVMGMRDVSTTSGAVLCASDQSELRGIQRIAREVEALPIDAPGGAA